MDTVHSVANTIHRDHHIFKLCFIVCRANKSYKLYALLEVSQLETGFYKIITIKVVIHDFCFHFPTSNAFWLKIESTREEKT